MAKFWRQNNRAAKITAALAVQIRKEYQSGLVTQGDLARMYKLSAVQIGRIVRGESWQNTPMLEPSVEEQRAILERLINVQKETDLIGVQPGETMEVQNNKDFVYPKRMQSPEEIADKMTLAETLKKKAIETMEKEAQERGPSARAKIMGGDGDRMLDELKGEVSGTNDSSK